MSNVTCPACGAYRLPDHPHGCPPLFRVRSMRGDRTTIRVTLLYAATHRYAVDLWVAICGKEVFDTIVTAVRVDNDEEREFEVAANGEVLEVPPACPDCDYASVDPQQDGWHPCREPGCNRKHWVRPCERHLAMYVGDVDEMRHTLPAPKKGQLDIDAIQARSLLPPTGEVLTKLRWEDVPALIAEVRRLREHADDDETVSDALRLRAERDQLVAMLQRKSEARTRIGEALKKAEADERRLRERLAYRQQNASEPSFAEAQSVESALKIADGYTQAEMGALYGPFHAAIETLAAEVRRQREELEREHMRLAGCGVAALGYFEGCDPKFESASLHDTVRLYAEKERLRLEVEGLREQLRVVTQPPAAPGYRPDATTEAVFDDVTRLAQRVHAGEIPTDDQGSMIILADEVLRLWWKDHASATELAALRVERDEQRARADELFDALKGHTDAIREEREGSAT